MKTYLIKVLLSVLSIVAILTLFINFGGQLFTNSEGTELHNYVKSEDVREMWPAIVGFLMFVIIVWPALTKVKQKKAIKKASMELQKTHAEFNNSQVTELLKSAPALIEGMEKNHSVMKQNHIAMVQQGEKVNQMHSILSSDIPEGYELMSINSDEVNSAQMQRIATAIEQLEKDLAKKTNIKLLANLNALAGQVGYYDRRFLAAALIVAKAFNNFDEGIELQKSIEDVLPELNK